MQGSDVSRGVRLFLALVGLAAFSGCAGEPAGLPADPDSMSLGLYASDGLTYTAYWGHDVYFMPSDEYVPLAAGPYPTVDVLAVQGDLASLPSTPTTFDLSEPQDFQILFSLPYDVDTASGTTSGYFLVYFVPGSTGLTGSITLSGTSGSVAASMELSYDGIHPINGSFWHQGIHGGGITASDEERLP